MALRMISRVRLRGRLAGRTGGTDVVDGIVKRIRPIEPDLDAWKRHGSKWEIPVSDPILDPAEIAEKFPTLGLSIGDALPAQRGKLREHLAL